MDGGSTGTELIEIVKGGHNPGPPHVYAIRGTGTRLHQI